MWWSKKVKYKPLGRLGHFNRNDYPYRYTIIFEKLCEINDRSRVKILEVDVKRDCTKTKEECLKDCSAGEWVSTSKINWETDEQYVSRTNQIIPQVFETPEELRNDDIDYSQHSPQLRHNFLQPNNH